MAKCTVEICMFTILIAKTFLILASRSCNSASQYYHSALLLPMPAPFEIDWFDNAGSMPSEEPGGGDVTEEAELLKQEVVLVFIGPCTQLYEVQ